jgi:hypothetical protein
MPKPCPAEFCRDVVAVARKGQTLRRGENCSRLGTQPSRRLGPVVVPLAQPRSGSPRAHTGGFNTQPSQVSRTVKRVEPVSTRRVRTQCHAARRP